MASSETKGWGLTWAEWKSNYLQLKYWIVMKRALKWYCIFPSLVSWTLKDYSWIVWERLWRFPTVCGRRKTNILCTDDLPGLQRVDPPSCKAVMQHAITPACLAPFGGKNCTIWWQNWSLDCVATLPVMRLSFERTLWFHCGKIKILTMSYVALGSG